MSRFREFLHGLHPLLLSSIASALTVAQVILAFIVRGQGSEAATWAGWICLWTAGLLATVPIITFRRKGKVARGQSYMKTTALVDSGLYAIVRHPQGGSAWLLINVGLMLVAWHWSSLVVGLPSMALVFVDTFKADQRCIGKFGPRYERYMERVPRVNFVAGIVRLVRSRLSAARG